MTERKPGPSYPRKDEVTHLGFDFAPVVVQEVAVICHWLTASRAAFTSIEGRLTPADFDCPALLMIARRHAP